MALTDAQLQAMVVNRVGDLKTVTYADGVTTKTYTVGLVADNVASIYAMFAYKARPNAPQLQYLYTVRECIDWILGALTNAIDYSSQGEQKSVSQAFAHYQQLRQDVQADIEDVERRASRITATSSPMTTASPYIPPVQRPYVSWPNPNDPRYRGDPGLPGHTTDWRP